MSPELPDSRSKARTKIVATVGPACRDEAVMTSLVEAGVDVFRINMAHSEPADAEPVLKTIRAVSQRLERPIAILVDLAGPKIRLGELAGGKLECPLGARFDFVRGEESHNPNELTSTYEFLIDELSPGDSVMLADGTVGMLVEEKLADRVRCRVVQRGRIRSRQGINLPGVTLRVPTLGDDDRQHAIWAAGAGVDFVSLSFVRSPQDVRDLKALLLEHKSQAHVVAKIEKLEALAQLDEIVAASDAVMVARGDLGVEMDVARMPMEQKRIIAKCREFQRPVIIATQMLESMHNSPRPTRAEATDVANAIIDGGDACMLSGETAIGEFPLAAVEMMNRIALATEDNLRSRPPLAAPHQHIPGLHNVTQSVVYGAGWIAYQLQAKVVVVASHSGATAQALSNQRNFVPTIGVSDQEATLRRMCLYWGVTPVGGLPACDVAALVKRIYSWGKGQGRIARGDCIVIVGGSHLNAAAHDLLLVHEVQ